MELNNPTDLAKLLEALLLAHNQPLSIERIESLFEEHEKPSIEQLKQALLILADACHVHAYELKEVATGYRLQVKAEFAPWISRLWEEKTQRYSRALLETLALIAYRQPITRGEIEDVRGVAVNSQIIKTLQEREWVRVVGYKDVPGKPAMLATTKAFLDYFNLQSLQELPALSSIRSVDELPILAGELFATSELPLIENTEVVADLSPPQITEQSINQPNQAKSFKVLLEQWNEMEKDVKTDFTDLIDSEVEPPPAKDQ